MAKYALPIAAAMFAAIPANAGAVTLPHIFGSHMVLQGGRTVPVWGWGTPGERVTVSIAGAKASAVTGADRRWRVDLPPLKTSARGQRMVVEGADRLVLEDVLVGDVWLASGQSNMEKPLGGWPGQKPTFGYEEELTRATWPTIRLFRVAHASADHPLEDVDGEWVVCTGEALERIKFSAVGFYFAKGLVWRDGAMQPVGVIESSVGGTMIEPWMPPAAFARHPSLERFAAAARTPGTKVWDAEIATLWNGMVAPLVPFAMTGVIWYQGESNALTNDPTPEYADKLRALAASWRAAFGGGSDFPFYIVQIAPYRYFESHGSFPLQHDSAAQIREAQAIAAATIPDSGLVVTSDLVDDLSDVHPRDKKSVGERLARLALAGHYRQGGIEAAGPTFAGAIRGKDGAVTVTFTHAAGLHTPTGAAPGGFELGDGTGRFFAADTRIDGDRVIASSRWVPAPVAVRMGYSDTMATNLANAAALPAAPFAAQAVK